RAFPREHALLVSVELCSLTLQREDLSPANVIASGLFGDGAAAVVLSGGVRAGAHAPLVLASRSVLFPNSEAIIGWDIVESGFEIILSPNLTDLVRASLARELDHFLALHGLARDDIQHWVVHPGGPGVLRAVQSTLELPAEALERSWRSLRTIGNL